MTVKKEDTLDLLKTALDNINITNCAGQRRKYVSRLLLARYAIKSAIFNIKRDG